MTKIFCFLCVSFLLKRGYQNWLPAIWCSPHPRPHPAENLSSFNYRINILDSRHWPILVDRHIFEPIRIQPKPVRLTCSSHSEAGREINFPQSIGHGGKTRGKSDKRKYTLPDQKHHEDINESLHLKYVHQTWLKITHYFLDLGSHNHAISLESHSVYLNGPVLIGHQ